MSVTVGLNGNISVTDSTTGTTSLRKIFAALTTQGTVVSEAQSASVGTSPTAIGLPVSPTNFIYIKNLHATQTLTVTWTPNGGSSNPVLTLQPGSAIIVSENNLVSGITALTLTGSGAATTYEYILAG